MGTRALIGYLDTSKKPMTLTTTYNHYDGYPSNLGKGLRNFYNDDERAKEIASVGYISFLDGATGEWEAKNKEQATTIRLDSEFVEAMIQIASEIDSVGADYGYIWCPSDDKWHMIENDGMNSMIQQLEEEFEHLNITSEAKKETMKNKDKVVAKGDGIEITQVMMDKLHAGQTVKLPNGSILTFVKEEIKEAIVSPDEQVSYLTNVLYDVYYKGMHTQDVNFESLAQSLVNNMFSDKAENLDEAFINRMKYKAGIIK